MKLRRIVSTLADTVAEGPAALFDYVGASVTNPRAVADILRSILEREPCEVFAVLLLNGKQRLTAYAEVSRGTLTASLVHPREVFGPALRMGAAAVIVAHNHPSGDPEPSAEDFAVTERLRQAGELLGVPVLNHVVIGEGGRFVSMRERWSSPAPKLAASPSPLAVAFANLSDAVREHGDWKAALLRQLGWKPAICAVSGFGGWSAPWDEKGLCVLLTRQALDVAAWSSETGERRTPPCSELDPWLKGHDAWRAGKGPPAGEVRERGDPWDADPDGYPVDDGPLDSEDWLIDGVGFADPGGESALRAATDRNPRNLPCPSCGEPGRLTPLDRAAGYQCDACARRDEGGGW